MPCHPYRERLTTTALTLLALVAFAANSVLCRLALGTGATDAAGFSTIRLGSGALALLLLVRLTGRRPGKSRGNWRAAAALFVYVVAFSFAYLSLAAGTGALILFGAVQGTMILAGLRSGERPRLWEWCGLFLALAGLVLLVLPGLSAPTPTGSLLMAVAGVSWGIYSLSGRGSTDPLAVTAGNFARAVPLVLALSLLTLPTLHASPKGALLAAVSGSLASAGGYVVWYRVLRQMTATFAATVQLAVPVLAAAGGVLFLAEQVTVRLLFSAAAILGGVGLAVLGRRRPLPGGTRE
ncbi:DMT family transporter [Geobacter sp.]|uniref:DMT family transporter n=1 Tax=Geobacter sp. TaxID=46610 RepID=UPI00262A7302|nr:DMT family transporter [Geobacter sp.]